jgi:hypothetical protein
MKTTRDASFLVVGTLRNCAETVSKTVTAILQALPNGAPVEWFLVESDSKDETVEELIRLSTLIPNFEFISMGELSSMIPDRVTRIGKCREIYLGRIRKASPMHFSHVVIADFDGINVSLSAGSIARAVSTFPSGATFSNSRGVYYDIFALRAKGWVENDYRALEAEFMKDGLGPIRSKWKALYQNQKLIPSSNKPIDVDSAFGGLGVYELKTLVGASYITGRIGSECEHVTLHRNLPLGTELRILPSLLNGPAIEHTLWRTGFRYVMIRMASKLNPFYQTALIKSFRMKGE